MEKEKLSNELKGLVGENSLSERTWNDYIDNSVVPFLPSDESLKNEYLSKHAAVIKSIAGQLNNEVATRVNEFKKTYKPEVPMNDHPLPTPNIEVPKVDDDSRLKSIEDRFIKLEQERANELKEIKRKQRLSDVQVKIKEQGADNDTVLKLTLSSIDLDENLSVDECVMRVKTAYDANYTAIYGDGYAPAGGVYSSTAGKKKNQESYMKHLEETGRIKTQTKN